MLDRLSFAGWQARPAAAATQADGRQRGHGAYCTILCCSGTECLSAVLIIHIDAAVLSNHQCVVVASRTTRLI